MKSIVNLKNGLLGLFLILPASMCADFSLLKDLPVSAGLLTQMPTPEEAARASHWIANEIQGVAELLILPAAQSVLVETKSMNLSQLKQEKERLSGQIDLKREQLKQEEDKAKVLLPQNNVVEFQKARKASTEYTQDQIKNIIRLLVIDAQIQRIENPVQ